MDQTSMLAQQFMRTSPEAPLPLLTDLQIDGLRPSSFTARLRCIAPCGCESAYSPWSVSCIPCVPCGGISLAPAFNAAPPAVSPGAAAALQETFPHACPPPPAAPPSLSTVLAPAVLLPPLPEGAADLAGTLAPLVHVVACGEVAAFQQAGAPPCPPPSAPPTFRAVSVLPAALPQNLEWAAGQPGHLDFPVRMVAPNAAASPQEVVPPPPSAPPSFCPSPELNSALPPILEEMADSLGNFNGDILTLD